MKVGSILYTLDAECDIIILEEITKRTTAIIKELSLISSSKVNSLSKLKK